MAEAKIKIGAAISEYQQAMRQAAAEMKKVSSEYSLAAANAKLYGTQSDVLRAKVTELTKKLELQKGVVEQNRTQHGNLTAKLEDQQKKQESLRQKVQAAEQAYRESAQATGEHSEETEKLKLEYEKLEAQLESSDRQIGKTKASITNQEAAVTQSEAALKQLELQLRDVNEELARQKFDEYAEKADKVGDAVTDAGQKMKVVTGAITAVGAASVKTAADFEAQMSKVKAISGATGEDFEKLTDKAKEMGAKTKFSASESAEAMEYMAMAGWKTGDMLNGIEGVMNLAAASGADLATTSDIVTDALTAFGLSAADSARFADILATASSSANTDVEMMGETFKYVAPVAGALGYSAEDTATAIGLMANSGIKSSQAGTALRAILNRLVTETGDAGKAMQLLGLSLTDEEGNMYSLMEVMEQMRSGFEGGRITQDEYNESVKRYNELLASGSMDLPEYTLAMEALDIALNGTTEAQQAEIAAMLAGQEAMSGLLAIVSASDEDFAKLSGAIKDCDGAAEEMAETMLDNLSGQATILKSAIEGVSISIGNILLPYVKDAVGWFSNLVDRFAGLDEGAQKAIVAVSAVVAAIGPLLLAAGKLITFSASVSSGLGTLSAALAKVGFGAAGAGTSTGAFSTIIAAITSPVGIAVAAIAALVAGLGYVAATNEDVRNSLMDVWRTFTANLQPIVEYISGTVLADLRTAWGNLMEMLQPLADFVKGALTSAWQDILIPVLEWIAGTVLPNVMDMMRNLWENVMRPLGGFIGSTLTPVIQFFADALTMLWSMVLVPLADFILTAFKAAWDGIYTVLNVAVIPVLNLLTTAFQFLWDNVLKQVVDWLTATMLPIFQTVFQTVGSVMDSLKVAFQGVVDFIVGIFTLDLTMAFEGIKAIFTGTWEVIKAIFGGALDAIQQALSAAWEAISTVAGMVWEGISSFFSNIWNAIYTTVSIWLNSVWQSVSDVFNSCWEVVQNIWQTIQNVIQVAVMFIIELFTASFELITAPFRFIWENCKDTVMSIWESIRTMISSKIEAVRGTIESVMNVIKAVMATVWGVIRTTVGTVWNAIRNTVTTVMDAIRAVMETVWNAISGAVTTVVNAIKNTVSSVFNAVKSTVTSIWNGIKSTTTSVWNAVKSAVTTPINAAKSAVSTAINSIKSTVSSVFNSVKSTVASVWNGIKTAISTPINTARDTVKNAIDRIKGFFNFSWSLPHLKLPHPKISGSFSLNPPSVPSFSIEWYRHGGIMTEPTLFGANGTTLFAGGEAGDEAILPLAPFYTSLSAMLDKKFEELKQTYRIYVTVVNEMDGEVIAEKTTEIVEDNIVKGYERSR